MKPLSLAVRTRRVFLLAVAISGLVLAALSLPTVETQTKLSLADVITGLRTQKVRGQTVTLEDRNRLLTQGVDQRGVTFTLTQELETELRGIGANDALIEAIRRKNPKPAPTPTPATPSPTPIPTPVSTPVPTALPTPEPPQLLASIEKDNQSPAPLPVETIEVSSPPRNAADAPAHKNNADELRRKGENEQAVAEYDTAIELDPNYQEAYYNRGLAHQNKRDYDLSIADFNRAVRLNPQDALAFYSRGISFHYKGAFARAAEDYRTAFKLKPEFFSRELTKCLLYEIRADSPGSGIESCTKLAAIYPAFSLIYVIRAAAYGDKRQFELALKDFTKAIELYPNFAAAYAGRASIHEKLGRTDLAAADRNKAKELTP
jgi:tetratricopeptide (TPR) repeat protein